MQLGRLFFLLLFPILVFIILSAVFGKKVTN